MMNKVVVHYLDGRVSKGVTLDFVPSKEAFHLSSAADDSKIARVLMRDLKAIFFVRTFEGDPGYTAPDANTDLQRVPGRKLRVTFRDGEIMFGNSAVYGPERDGFFLIPVDPNDNNERVYVLTRATKSVEMVKPSVAV
jgi:hypothetical protein